MKLFSFRNFRVLLLLTVLATAAIYTKAQRLESTAWVEPLQVAIFPINGDQSSNTAAYINRLTDRDFMAIDRFTSKEARKYQIITRQPTRTRLGPEVEDKPPAPPGRNANLLDNMLWSLRFRYWAWQHTPDELSDSNQVRLFVIYQQGTKGRSLQHSLGMQKGLLGLVHAFADPRQQQQNNLVIAHELLHTVGATDKYDQNGQPIYPHGYGQPDRNPRYPQSRAEIMSGRIALSRSESKMAGSLGSTLVGRKTAREINWIQSQEY